MSEKILELVDDAEVIFDQRTESTRWVLWRKTDTRKLCLALVQRDQVVSVNIENILFLVARALPEHCRIPFEIVDRAHLGRLLAWIRNAKHLQYCRLNYGPMGGSSGVCTCGRDDLLAGCAPKPREAAPRQHQDDRERARQMGDFDQ